MKHFILITLFAILASAAFAQPDKVVGIWLTEEGDSQVQLYRTPNGTYSGKIVWMKNDINAKDDNNPDQKLKTRKIMGLQLLNNFSYTYIINSYCL